LVELAPPAVETPLLRGEFAEEMKEQKGMDVKGPRQSRDFRY
jgi:uncharacterized oxidoreductase